MQATAMLSSSRAGGAQFSRQITGGALRRPCVAPQRRNTLRGSTIMAAAGATKTTLEFIRGFPEPSVPDVQLTRAKDGSSGTATFIFKEPSVFEAAEDMGEITGLYMTDPEGTISTVDVQHPNQSDAEKRMRVAETQAKFVNGKPDRIEARYLMRSALEWDRFMRFMERYAEDQDLGFSKA